MTAIVSGNLNLGAGNVAITSGNLTFGSSPPPPPPPQNIGVVGFHTLSNGWSVVGAPTSFPGALFFAPNYDNAVNMGSPAQLADIKSQIDAWKAANNIGELRAGGISGGSYTGLMMAAAYPGMFKRMSLWLILYDLVAWSSEANSGDFGIVQSGMGVPYATNPLPYYQRSPRWNLDAIGETTMQITLNAGLQDGVTPIHHARECYRRLKGLPNVTVTLNEFNGGHTFDGGALVSQLS